MKERILLLALLVVPAITGPLYAQQSTLDHNRGMIRIYFDEVWNKGRLEALDTLLDAGYINHTPSVAHPEPGPQGLKPIVLAIRKAFPDLHYEIKDIIVTEDRVVARVLMTGTHTGDLFGMAPTGKRIAVEQINIEKISHGRIVEHWRVTDELGMMKQLGKY
ncbi:ester cyclase [Taibaiella koreensis]|uniref:ester cyclase n=1 Tax=Taibaiella koreensis TaxID=1268548 RepID=UPI000E59ED8F|nr:ester cyclase [Taibaiella koreensis]